MNRSIKSAIVVSLISLAAAAMVAAETNSPAVIPKPQKLELLSGVFRLHPRERETPGTIILAGVSCEDTARYLAVRLRKCSGFEWPVQAAPAKGSDKGQILVTTKDAKADLGAEGYDLRVTPETVVIRAANAAGAFYGVQTLLQLLPSSSGADGRMGLAIPCLHIEDQPRFKWRGLMLDVSRHFFTKDEIKQLLDAMAIYKLNTFHWHLTDDQGWRIEIKKYPRLTQVGAWRKEVGFGLDPKSGTAFGADGRYGGFYTQDDIREVVAYAQTRHITVVPEIEMPGHASAALMAYPEFSCTGGPFTTDLPGGVFNGIYCAGNDDAFTFLQGVLFEIFELFPGKYIHIGGDEVLTNNWHNCAKCQARLKQEGLKQDADLEGYFIRRMEKFITAHDRTLVGWSEIREGGLAQNAVVMDWVGGAIEAASAGHDVVMSPLADCYFDRYQSRDQASEPKAIGGYLPLPQVYGFEPLPAGLPPQFQAHILGAQANVWTEYMPSFKQVEYMVFPRLCALSEVVWTPKNARDWDDFAKRMESHYTRLAAQGINFRRASSASSGAESDARAKPRHS